MVSPSPRSALVLALLCGAQFMVVLDIAIVNVALPSIEADLGLDRSDLQWVVITYGLVLGGFLLLGGRAADLLGRRRVLVTGLALFTAASLTGGLAGSLAPLVASRAVQGFGAALVAPAALSILASSFPEGRERNRALGIFGAVGGSAASFGVIAGGVLTDGPGWAWIFFVNVPIGVALIGLVLRFIPTAPRTFRGRADVLGALTVTGGLMALVYAIHQSADHGWTSGRTLGFLAGGAALLAVFLAVERATADPLVPMHMLRRRTLNAANLVAALVFGSFFATIFQASLFMQQVLGYSPLRTGFAYLAIALVALVVSGGGAPVVVGRAGAGTTLGIGQASSALGLLLLARAPSDAAYWTDLFPGFVLVGVGIGFSVVAAQIAAFNGVEPAFSGLAGGMIETAREMGGALGTAIVASVAIGATDAAEGFQRGSLVAAGFNVLSVIAALAVLRRAERRSAPVVVADLEPVLSD